MDYVLVKNGKLVQGHQVVQKDLLIGNNKVVLIQDKISRPEPETPVIDAQGKYILPGAIDFNISFSSLKTASSEYVKRFSQGAVLSGTTTMLEPLFPDSSFDFKKELFIKRNSEYPIQSDYGFHLSLQGWLTLEVSDLEFCYSHDGIASMYLQWPLSQESEYNQICQALVYCANKDITVLVDLQRPESLGSGYLGMNYLQVETIDQHLNQLRSIIDLASKTACKICLLNVCFKEELDIINQLEPTNLLYVELTMPYDIGHSEQLVDDGNAIFSGFPLVGKLSLIPVSHLCKLLKDERFTVSRPMLNLSGTDVVKESQVDNRPDEFFLYKNYLSVLYTTVVSQGCLSIADFSSIISERIAKLIGLYPQKGVISVGSDADLFVWDPDYQRNLDYHLPSEDASGVVSHKLEGRVEFVFLKGHMVYNGEGYRDAELRGHYVYRSPFTN